MKCVWRARINMVRSPKCVWSARINMVRSPKCFMECPHKHGPVTEMLYGVPAQTWSGHRNALWSARTNMVRSPKCFMECSHKHGPVTEMLYGVPAQTWSGHRNVCGVLAQTWSGYRNALWSARTNMVRSPKCVWSSRTNIVRSPKCFMEFPHKHGPVTEMLYGVPAQTWSGHRKLMCVKCPHKHGQVTEMLYGVPHKHGPVIEIYYRKTVWMEFESLSAVSGAMLLLGQSDLFVCHVVDWAQSTNQPTNPPTQINQPCFFVWCRMTWLQWVEATAFSGVWWMCHGSQHHRHFSLITVTVSVTSLRQPSLSRLFD